MNKIVRIVAIVKRKKGGLRPCVSDIVEAIMNSGKPSGLSLTRRNVSIQMGFHAA